MTSVSSVDPLVSIVIPVYNGANYLADAIESALAQTYRNKEVLVVNDGSSDDGATARIAARYARWVRYFEKPNGGIATALNFGIAEQRGELFSWLSHDDLYEPEKLEEQVRCYTSAGGNCIVYSDFFVVDKDARKINAHRLPRDIHDDMRCFLASSNALHGCTLLIPRAFLQSMGGFNEHLATTQDYDMWFRLAARYQFVHVAKSLVRVRYHNEQTTSRMLDLIVRERDAMYTSFLHQLARESVERYSRHDPTGFYLKLYCRYHAGRLREARDLAKQMALQSSIGGDMLRIQWARFVVAPIVRARVDLRNYVFDGGSSGLPRVVLSLVRYLSVLRR